MMKQTNVDLAFMNPALRTGYSDEIFYDLKYKVMEMRDYLFDRN